MIFPPHVQKIISNYYIFGVIPLDKTLHVLVGFIVTIILQRLRFRLRTVFLILAILEIFKEVHDSRVLNSTMEEHILDVLATVLYPVILILIRQYRRSQK